MKSKIQKKKKERNNNNNNNVIVELLIATFFKKKLPMKGQIFYVKKLWGGCSKFED